MEELGIADYRGYLRLLQRDSREAGAFANRIRLTLSRFFRERERWTALAVAMEDLLEKSPPASVLRVWSAGCCGGEEPYSLAILWRESLAGRYPRCRLHVVATDIDEVSLSRASRGWYEASSLREVPPEERERWFRREGGLYRIDDSLREPVSFRRSDLLAESPADNMDLVLCRYLVFTYYRGERRHAAAARLRDALRPGGLLMIGRKEGLTPADLSLFEPWRDGTGIFRRRSP
jgi:chemotaxis methyl-accepting protein methylase